jgi:hypothetical protein
MDFELLPAGSKVEVEGILGRRVEGARVKKERERDEDVRVVSICPNRGKVLIIDGGRFGEKGKSRPDLLAVASTTLNPRMARATSVGHTQNPNVELS